MLSLQKSCHHSWPRMPGRSRVAAADPGLRSSFTPLRLSQGLSLDSLRQLALLLAIFVLSCSSAQAQVCFRGRPVETCRSFFLTEFGARFNPTRDSAGEGFSDRLTVPITAGWMRNVGARSAFGGTIGLDPDTEYSDWFFSFGPRYRYWLSRTASLDGMVSLTIGEGGIRNVNLQAVLMYGDWIGVDVGVLLDMVDDAYAREAVRPFVGARVGSYAGLVAYAVTAAVFALFASAYSGT